MVIPTEELWMEDFVDTRTKTRSKGIYVTSDAIRNKLAMFFHCADKILDIRDKRTRCTKTVNQFSRHLIGDAPIIILYINNNCIQFRLVAMGAYTRITRGLDG